MSTEEAALYNTLPAALKASALAMLAIELEPSRDLIQKAYDADPEGWAIPYHFYWGMHVRNLLRKEGYGEKYFRVDNLDDIYVYLVEEALGLGRNQ